MLYHSARTLKANWEWPGNDTPRPTEGDKEPQLLLIRVLLDTFIVPGGGSSAIAQASRASMDEPTEPEFLAPAGVVGRASRPRDPRTKAKYNIFSRLLLW